MLLTEKELLIVVLLSANKEVYDEIFVSSVSPAELALCKLQDDPVGADAEGLICLCEGVLSRMDVNSTLLFLMSDIKLVASRLDMAKACTVLFPSWQLFNDFRASLASKIVA